MVDDRCRECGAVFNLFTGTGWSGTRYTCRQIGVAQGVPLQPLAEALGLHRSQLLERRHESQQLIQQRLSSEWRAYLHWPEHGRTHKQVCYEPGQRQWAWAEDGDGVREVPSNTAEGMGTGRAARLIGVGGVDDEFRDHILQY
jgi:hypothetical protein